MIINSIIPANGTEGVALGTNIVITFNDIVDETTISNAIYIEEVTYGTEDEIPEIQPFNYNEKIEYTYEVDNTNGYTVLTIKPNRLFKKNVNVRIFITNTLLDQTGTPLEENYLSEFYTTNQDIETPPDNPSTTIGYLPDLSDVFTNITNTTTTTGLSIISSYPLDESWGYDNVEQITFKFNDNIDIIDAQITVAILDLTNLQIEQLEETVDYTISVNADELVIDFIEPITGDNKKVYVKLLNIRSATDPNIMLQRYEYEFVTNFNPINADVGIILAEAANLSNADSYYLMHIVYYASREADIMTPNCDPNDPIVVYYKQRWVMAKVLNDLLSRVVQSSGNLFTTEKTLAYFTIKRKIDESTLPNTLNRTADELKRYELPLLTCGDLLPDAHLKPTNTLMYKNSKNVMQAGRLYDTTNKDIALNTIKHANDDLSQYFWSTYGRGDKFFTHDREL